MTCMNLLTMSFDVPTVTKKNKEEHTLETTSTHVLSSSQI